MDEAEVLDMPTSHGSIEQMCMTTLVAAKIDSALARDLVYRRGSPIKPYCDAAEKSQATSPRTVAALNECRRACRPYLEPHLRDADSPWPVDHVLDFLMHVAQTEKLPYPVQLALKRP